jgi:spore germination protein
MRPTPRSQPPGKHAVREDSGPDLSARIRHLAPDRYRPARRPVTAAAPALQHSHANGGHAATRRGRHQRRGLIAAALVVASALAAGVGVVIFAGGGGPTLQTEAVVPYWNFSRGLNTVLAHKGGLTMVSPWMYSVTSSGAFSAMGETSAAADAVLVRLRRSGLKLVPTIANYSDGAWRYELIAPMLHDLAGVDIDYEELTASDRDAFSRFISALGRALHRRGKILSVDVFAKASDAGYDQRNEAQDYRALGQAADQVRLMAYDYHWPGSAPGPVAPIWWVNQVLSYATREIPAKKIVLGVPLYGYDWSGGKGTAMTWLQVFGLLKEHPSPVHWDEASQSPWLRYTDRKGRHHELWFENAYSASAKFEAAHRHGIGGVYLWMFGDEDALTWTKLREQWTDGHATSVATTTGARS